MNGICGTKFNRPCCYENCQDGCQRFFIFSFENSFHIIGSADAEDRALRERNLSAVAAEVESLNRAGGNASPNPSLSTLFESEKLNARSVRRFESAKHF